MMVGIGQLKKDSESHTKRFLSLFRRQPIVFSRHSVQFSCVVVSDTLWPHEPQHARPPSPSPTPGLHPNPCPLCWWCHPTSHPLSSPSHPALNLSQNQGLFKWVSSSLQVAKVLEFQLQHQSFQWIFRTDFFRGTGWISLHFKGLSRVFSTPQFKSINSSAWISGSWRSSLYSSSVYQHMVACVLHKFSLGQQK